MEKHAYIMVANANFRVLAACLTLIDDPRNDIFILFDKKSGVSQKQRDDFKALCTQSRLTILNDMVVNWAGWSQIKAVLNLLAAAVGSGEEYRYIHFLQGSDLPIKSQDEIHAYFATQSDEFVLVEQNRQIMAINKAEYRHFFCHNRFFRKNKIVKAINFTLVKLQKMLHIRKNKDVELHQGSALFSITGNCARYILSKEKEIFKRFRLALAADEVFIQTMLMNSPYKESLHLLDGEQANGNLCNARLIDRTRPDGKNSPHVWRLPELEAILSQPAGICFARKFDERLDFAVVERLITEIKNRD